VPKQRQPPRQPNSPRTDQEFCYREGSTPESVRRPRAPPGVPGFTRRPFKLPPLSSPGASPDAAAIEPPLRADGGLRHVALGWRGRTPGVTPTNGGYQRAAFSVDLAFQVWPAAIHPQTPSLPATRGRRASVAAWTPTRDAGWLRPWRWRAPLQRTTTPAAGSGARSLGPSRREVISQAGKTARALSGFREASEPSQVCRRDFSHFYTYSPTSIGSKFLKHMLMCTEIFQKPPLTMGMVRAFVPAHFEGPPC
jgi:hypothetical protein